jgi:hypothetical protein
MTQVGAQQLDALSQPGGVLLVHGWKLQGLNDAAAVTDASKA